MDTTTTLILQLTAALAVLALVCSIYVVVARLLSERKQRRILAAREHASAVLADYVAGRSTTAQVLAVLGRDRNVAMGVLLDISDKMPITARRRLQPVVDALGLETDEVFALSHRQPARRAGAAVRLGYMSGYVGRDALRDALQDPDLDVRLAAARALAQRGDASMALPILEALALPGNWPLQRATEVLVALGPGVIEPLRTFLRGRGNEDHDPGIAVALGVLGLLEARQAAPDVLRFLRHFDADVRVAAVRALGGMGSSDSAGALGERLRDPAWQVRSIAAKALGQVGTQSCVPGLGDALTDSAWWVRCNAAQALYDIGGEGRAVLESAAQGHLDPFARDISRQTLQEQAVLAAREPAEATP